MLTCGSPCTAWLEKSAFGFADVTVTDVTDEIAALSLQGPTSCAVLKKMGLDGIETAKPFDIMHFPFHGDTLMVSRTGFTGDLGYELWISAGPCAAIYGTNFTRRAKTMAFSPIGEAATNMARLEAAFIMPSMEFNEALRTVNFEHDQTPFELNLGWLVDFKKPHFSGRGALLEEKKRGPKYTLTKLDIEGNKPAEGSYIYKDKRCTREIGYVTSAMWSPAVKANIALAMIKTEHVEGELWAEIYYEKELRQYNRVVRCTRKDRNPSGHRPEHAQPRRPTFDRPILEHATNTRKCRFLVRDCRQDDRRRLQHRPRRLRLKTDVRRYGISAQD